MPLGDGREVQMSLTELTDPDAVRRAVAEHEQLGGKRFLALYGCSPARAYFLELGGRKAA